MEIRTNFSIFLLLFIKFIDFLWIQYVIRVQHTYWEHYNIKSGIGGLNSESLIDKKYENLLLNGEVGLYSSWACIVLKSVFDWACIRF